MHYIYIYIKKLNRKRVFRDFTSSWEYCSSFCFLWSSLKYFISLIRPSSSIILQYESNWLDFFVFDPSVTEANTKSQKVQHKNQRRISASQSSKPQIFFRNLNMALSSTPFFSSPSLPIFHPSKYNKTSKSQKQILNIEQKRKGFFYFMEKKARAEKIMEKVKRKGGCGTK